MCVGSQNGQYIFSCTFQNIFVGLCGEFDELKNTISKCKSSTSPLFVNQCLENHQQTQKKVHNSSNKKNFDCITSFGDSNSRLVLDVLKPIMPVSKFFFSTVVGKSCADIRDTAEKLYVLEEMFLSNPTKQI